MAVLRRSASLLKEEVIEFKIALNGKKGTGTRPACDTSISRSHTGHNNAMSSCMRKAKEVAASISKLMPTRSNRGKPPFFPQVLAYILGSGRVMTSACWGSVEHCFVGLHATWFEQAGNM